MPTPVLEAPAKVEEAKVEDRRSAEEEYAGATWVPLFGAIAAADPLAHPITVGTDLQTKTNVLLHLQRTAGNRATRDWIEGRRVNTVTVARSPCCEGCASGGPCGAAHADAEEALPIQRGVVDDAAAAAAGMLTRLRTRASAFVTSIRAAVGRVWDRVQGLAREVGARLRRAMTAALERLGSVFAALRQRVQALVARVRAAAERVAERLRQGVERILGLLRRGWDALKAGARAFLERIKSVATAVMDRIKGMGRSMFGSMSGQCLDTPTAEAAVGRYEAVAGPGETEVAESATSGLAGLHTQFDTRDADGEAQLGGLDASAGAAIAQTMQESEGAAAAAEAGHADLGAQAATTITGLTADASREVTGTEGRAEAGAGEVDTQKASGLGGLRGLLGSLVAAVTGAADQIVSGANHEAEGAASGLRGRFQSLFASLRELAASLVENLRSAARQVIDGVKAFAQTIVAQARALWQMLRDAWARLKERGRAALQQLRQWWRQLVEKATAGWRAIQSFLARMRSRAAAALFNTCGDACSLASAKQEGRRLDATQVPVPSIAFKARPGGARPPVPDELVAIQASLVGGGQPLAASTRLPMEAAFGADLSGTRIHTGATAAALASGMNARAFTIGEDIAFGHGEFDPGSVHGDALIAHEVAHVLQQRRGSADGSAAEPAAEHDADHSAAAVVARLWGGLQHGISDIATNAGPRIQSGLALRRCPSGKCCEVTEQQGALTPEKAAGNMDNPRPSDLLTGRGRIESKTGDVYGQTGVGYGHTLRDLVNTKSSVSDKCGQLCKPNISSYPTFSLSPFFFVAAGRYQDFDFNVNTGAPGARRFAVAKSGPCKGKSRPRVTIVTEAVANKARAAEVEHAHDLARAWDLSVAKYIAAVKELEGGFCVPGEEPLNDAKCTEEFRTRVGSRSGISWGGWTSVADCLAGLSKTRDDNEWHTVPADTATKVGTKDCKEVEVTPDASGLTNIGNHPTKEIVDDNAAACGAGGGP